MTKAHVFAKSWTALFDDPNDTRDHEVAHHYIDPNTGKRRLIKRSKTFALVSRKVCGDCNSGWLNELETRVRPLMAAFASNSSVVLDAEAQADLALWALAGSLIAMSQDPNSRDFADPELPRELHRTRRPPAGANVYVGANAHGEMGWFGAHTLEISGSPEGAKTWGATITLGYGVMHVVCHGLADQRLRLRGQANKSLRRIWDPRERQVTWPPKLRLRPFDLSPLAIAVGDESSFERAIIR